MLVIGDLATKIRRFLRNFVRENGNTNLATRIGNRISPSCSSFSGEFYAPISTRESVYITRNATVHVLLAATARWTRQRGIHQDGL